MKKYFKLATLFIVLCLCFAITGFGNKKDTMIAVSTRNNSPLGNLEAKYAKYKEQMIKITCKGNVKNIATACEMYAADHNGKYPKTLNAIVEEGNTIQYFKIVQKGMYFDHVTTQAKEVPKCPIDNCEYKFVSKYIKIGDKNRIDYYIIKCPKHPLVFDSSIGIMDLENADNSVKNYYNSIKHGIVPKGRYLSEDIKLTPEDLKKLGIK